MLVPPMNFGLVEEGIYRCGKLEQINNAFLETLQLKSVILLDAEKPPRQLRVFFENNETDIYHLGGFSISSSFAKKSGDGEDDEKAHVSTTNTSKASSKENLQLSGFNSEEFTSMPSKNEEWMVIKGLIIAKVFELLLNRRLFNVLLVDSTETLVGVLRKIQRWNYTSIINEYRLYAGNKSNYFAENFLEMVRVELLPHTSITPKEPEKTSEQSNEAPKPPSPVQELPPVKAKRKSIDEAWDKRGETDDEDEGHMSGSPKIPSALLRIVELRKQKKSQEKQEQQQKEQEQLQLQQKELQKQQLLAGPQSFTYYKSWNDSDVKFSKVGVTKMKLPKEEDLPSWFVRQRDFWEKNLNIKGETY
ncbi:hypothetical protein BABINDRAFT_114955 [Babjeviella inositovora NRRL Y-12698]|uniref:Protein OCA4 n=1 Tax=Babjeviella inositovora NRRL Y-12698 TaxID=984486 RepID=A0A1E3QX17_9ASCO|nr:uncharacterized protein BABINDRAFT_114955 [Babjeviella inositovora NRRL Y-12698]ODQ82064.1 hypothetical protein BABINDRAFT_114955 [Babjeviella inositovora NRRL Y-12698]